MCHPDKVQKSDEDRSLIERVELRKVVHVQDVEKQVRDHFVGGQGQTCLQCNRFPWFQGPLPRRREQIAQSLWIFSKRDRRAAKDQLVLKEVLLCKLF